MSDTPFVSFAQNCEDVVLWRALHDVQGGRYVEVGGNDPVTYSVVKAFSDRGWSGMSVEPDPAFAARLREARPRDAVVEAAVTSRGDSVTLHLVEGTGLSTLDDEVSERHARTGYPSREVTVRGARLDDLLAEHGFEQDVHFAVVDVEGLEADVLSTVDLGRWRPWVLVVEATAPLTTRPTHAEWEPAVLAAGYELCLFDGISRFYVASEHADRLRAALSYPACVLDDFVTAREQEQQQRLEEQGRQLEEQGRRLEEQERDLNEHVRLLREHIEAQEGLVAGLRAEADRARQESVDETLRWRRAALVRWADGAVARSGAAGPQIDALHARVRHLEEELERTRDTVSWRLTAPLRVVRRTGHRA